MAVLEEIYQKELDLYREELQAATRYSDKEMFQLNKRMSHYNPDYAKVLLVLFMDRCNLRSTLAFCQFRKSLPGSPITALKELFDGRKEYILKLLDIVCELKGYVKKNLAIPMPPEDQSVTMKSAMVTEVNQ